jgi:hypothetical protein
MRRGMGGRLVMCTWLAKDVIDACEGHRRKMSDHHSEEELFAQLQLALVPASASLPTFNVRDAYWEFLDRALHFNMPVVFSCRCSGGCGHRNGTVHRPPLIPMIEPFPRVPTNSPFKVRENTNSLCVMCFDDIASNHKTLDLETQLPTAIACPRNHLICRGCLDHLIVERCNTVLHTPSAPSQIDCPACLAARALSRFGFDRYGQIVSSTTVVASYTQEQLKHACGGASDAALQLLESVAQADEKLAAMSESEQITNGNTDCYLCPKCKFGPVAHQACSDLVSHHGSHGVSNKCPKCGFLGSSISEWIQIAEPRAPAFTAQRHRHRQDPEYPTARGFIWPHLEHRHWRDFDTITSVWPVEERWRPPTNGFQIAPTLRHPAIDLHIDAPFQIHLDPSYWDAPIRRLMQAALRAAQAADATPLALAPASAFSTLAISDGSEQTHAVSSHRTNQDARQLSLFLQESHRCLRVTNVDHVHTISHRRVRVCEECALLPLANFQRRTQKYRTVSEWEVQLFMRLFEKAMAAPIHFVSTRMAIGAETEGMQRQWDMRHGKQIARTLVV